MRKLDFYISKKFLSILFFTIFGWMVLFVVIDLIEKLGDFLSNNASFPQVFEYYILYIPFIIILTLPMSMLLSSLFCLGSMSQANEIIAIQSAGISLYRLLLPLLIVSLLISIAAGVANETVVPKVNRTRLDLLRYGIKKEKHNFAQNRERLALQDDQRREIFIQFYDGVRKRGHNINIIRTRDNRVLERWDAEVMDWEENHSRWLLRIVTVRRLKDFRETVTHLDTLPYSHSGIFPSDLQELQIKPEEMNYAELSRFVDKMTRLGADARRWIVDLYMKIAYPLSNFIIVLFGAPLASYKRRSGSALGFGMALLISFIYFLFLRSGQVLGHKGALSPWIAAWIGDIVFGFAGLVVMIKIRK